MSARLAPVEPPYPPQLGAILESMMGASGQPPLLLFRTLARHEPLLDRFRQIGATMLSFGRLDAADRETVIHRTTARCGAAYEWGVHAAAFARPLGLSDDWLAATWHGDAGDPAFTARQALLVRACDELHDDGVVTAATWDGLCAELDDEQLVELVCLAGFYHLVSFCCGAFALEPEPWAEAPPAA